MADRVYLHLTNDRVRLEDDDIGEVPEEYNTFQIIKLMHWDWWTFQRQPEFFLEMVRSFLLAEKRASDRMKSRDK